VHASALRDEQPRGCESDAALPAGDERHLAGQASHTTDPPSIQTPVTGVEAVHALAGVMEDKNAAKGVLVTTSWVGKASRDFAARNGSRIEIIEGRQLKYMLKEHLGLDVLISLPKLPPGWEQQDIS
jgi:hypothetical protein